MSNVLWQRVASAAVLIPIAVWTVLAAPAWLFAAVVAMLSGAAAWELARLFERAGHVASAGAIAACAAAVTASFAVPGAPVATLAAATMVLLACALWMSGPAAGATVTAGLSSLVYVGVLLGHALLLHQLPGGRTLILFLLVVTWAGETAAYAVGSLVGRHRLAPRISPGKTVEGAVGQVVVSGAAALVCGGLVPGWSQVATVGAGLVLGIVGQIGDLAESGIKRSVGVKDTGRIIPGHGGFLDRIDGLLFNIPTLFYWVGALGGHP